MINCNFTVSIVLYNHGIHDIQELIESLNAANFCKKIFIIDHTKNNQHEDFYCYEKVFYIHQKNLGFGSGHNVAIKLASNISDFHFVINPDIKVEISVFYCMINRILLDNNIGLIVPKVVSWDNSLQSSCKLLPTPLNLLTRRFPYFFKKSFCDKLNFYYELQFADYGHEMNIPFLSGCFMLLRLSVINKVGMFDERFFLYMEDLDLSRRIHEKFITLFFPDVKIIHRHTRGSYANLKLLYYHISSSIRYFNKWGWFDDQIRKKVNGVILQRLKN